MNVVFTAHGRERLVERSALDATDSADLARAALRRGATEVWYDDGKRNVCCQLPDGCWLVMRRSAKRELVVITVLTWNQFRYNKNRWWSKTPAGSTKATASGFWKPFAHLLKEAK